jgi:LysR family transcriptional regulator, chromosome initiation inhibitor
MSLLSPPLRAFVAIVHSKTVVAAAKQLGITQTGVTQRIRALEAQLMTTLFIRSRTGMNLTEEGQALFRYCQGAQDLEGQAFAQIQKAGTVAQIQVRIGGPTSIMRSRVIPACLPVMRDWKNLLLSFQITDEPSLVAELRSGASQLVIVPPEDVAREMDSKLLRPERYLLVATSKWKDRLLSDLITNERIIDFDSSDQMSFNYLRRFDLLDRAKKDRYFANSTEAICEMFCAGLGYGVLTSEFAEPWLKQKKLIALNGNRHLENRLALAWYPRPQRAPYFDALIKAIH